MGGDAPGPPRVLTWSKRAQAGERGRRERGSRERERGKGERNEKCETTNGGPGWAPELGPPGLSLRVRSPSFPGAKDPRLGEGQDGLGALIFPVHKLLSHPFSPAPNDAPHTRPGAKFMIRSRRGQGPSIRANGSGTALPDSVAASALGILQSRGQARAHWVGGKVRGPRRSAQRLPPAPQHLSS